MSQTFLNAKYIAKEVRIAFPDCFNIMGGYHISALPKELASEFDVGVLGEGEVTLYE